MIILFKKIRIKSLETVSGKVLIPCKKGQFIQRKGSLEGVGLDQCLIKKLAAGRYLIGYFNPYKSGSYSAYAGQNKINQYVILFPSAIKQIIFE